jgi:hypothetical protein
MLSSEGIMNYEDIKPHVSRESGKKLAKTHDINKLSSGAILWHLFVRHYRVLAFVLSVSLNVLYILRHFGIYFN